MSKKSIEEQIRNAAKRAGITAQDFKEGVGASAIGDGSLWKRFLKFIDFIKLIGPIIGPILIGGEGVAGVTAAPDDE